MYLKKTIAMMISAYLLPSLGRAQTILGDSTQRAQTKQAMLGDSVEIVVKQKNAHFDSSYYHSYPRELTGRVYWAHKLNTFLLDEPAGTLKYKPNTPPNIGIGATYGYFSLNISAGLGFFAPPGDKGKTHYFDFQAHFYWRTMSVDLFGQFYRGYYLSNGSYPGQQADYARPDMKVNFIGAAAYYVVNFRHFSNRAYAVQDEWQERSAGSLLLGTGIYYGAIKGDSALAPSAVHADSTGYNIHGAHFFMLGPGIGYAYTFVYKRHYFLTGGATVAAGLGYTREYGNGDFNRLGVTPILTYRLAAGYNSAYWGVGGSWVYNRTAVSGEQGHDAYLVRSGLYQITLSHRFGLNARTRKTLNSIEKVKNSITP